MCRKGKRYTSDLTDQQWALLSRLLPLKRGGRGRPITMDMREAVNAMLYVLKTGCQWRNLPTDFPPRQSVYYHYRKWCLSGLWERVNRALCYLTRRRLGRLPHPSAGVIDSQSVKTTEVGGLRGYDAGKQVNGRKRHVLVDTLGLLWLVVVHAASIQDYDGARLLLQRLPPMLRLRIKKLWADRRYQQHSLRAWCFSQLQLVLEIVAPPAKQSGFILLPRRWVVERTFAWLGNYRRLSKDYEECTLSSEGMIYLASIHLLLRRLA